LLQDRLLHRCCEGGPILALLGSVRASTPARIGGGILDLKVGDRAALPPINAPDQGGADLQEDREPARRPTAAGTCEDGQPCPLPWRRS
jgi:hypothetical protein